MDRRYGEVRLIREGAGRSALLRAPSGFASWSRLACRVALGRNKFLATAARTERLGGILLTEADDAGQFVAAFEALSPTLRERLRAALDGEHVIAVLSGAGAALVGTATRVILARDGQGSNRPGGGSTSYRLQDVKSVELISPVPGRGRIILKLGRRSTVGVSISFRNGDLPAAKETTRILRARVAATAEARRLDP